MSSGSAVLAEVRVAWSVAVEHRPEPRRSEEGAHR
jgi:hypothetical protein